MSKLIVEITPVLEVKEHDNADKLEILRVKGWDVIASKGAVSEGDHVVFIPPDAVLPQALHEHLSITKYCAELPKGYGDADHFERPTARRVKAARLRGKPSYGTIMTMSSFLDYMKLVDKVNTTFFPGDDVAETLGITKWEPPVKVIQGDVARDLPAFHKYTSIENWRNYPDVLRDGEQVVMTEKLHGCVKNDTQVSMTDGTTKAIEDIKVGEKVRTYDVDKGIFTSSTVEGILIQDKTDQLDWFELQFDNGKTLVCTEDHPVLTTDGWVQAKDLTENHVIL